MNTTDGLVACSERKSLMTSGSLGFKKNKTLNYLHLVTRTKGSQSTVCHGGVSCHCFLLWRIAAILRSE